MSKRSEWAKRYRVEHLEMFARMMRNYRHKTGLNKRYYSKYQHEALGILDDITSGSL